MTKQELAASLADNTTGMTKKQANQALDVLGDLVANALARGEEIVLPGIGKLHVEHKEARKGRNPGTGAEIDIPAKNVPKFSAAKALKDAVNG
jgi:DNA-binding protein HU-beta